MFIEGKIMFFFVKCTIFFHYFLQIMYFSMFFAENNMIFGIFNALFV